MTIDKDALLSERVPGFHEASSALEQIQKIKLPTVEDSTPLGAVAAWLNAELRAGRTPTGAEVLKRAHKAVTEVEAREAAGGAIQWLRHQLASERDSLSAQSTDVILEAMAEELSAIVSEVAALQPLDELASPNTAIDADRAPDFKKLEALGERYVTLRRDQVKLIVDAAGGSQPKHPLVLFVRDVDAVLPTYKMWNNRGPVVPPWPISDDQVGIERHTVTGRDTVIRDVSAPAFLTWAVTAGVELALPTYSEYRTIVARLDDPWRDREEPLGVVFDWGRGQLVHTDGNIDLSADRR